jgi:hypothetical protein
MLARIVQAFRAVAGRCWWPVAAAVAVTAAVSRVPGIGCAGVTRLCTWCENPIPAKVRRDALCCSVRCRQARHRFLRAVGYAESVAPGRRLRLAYADPPYPGKARLYRDHPDYGGEVDLAALTAGWPPMTGGPCPHPRRRCQRCWRCARPVSGWPPGTGASVLPAAGGRCTPWSQSSITAAASSSAGRAGPTRWYAGPGRWIRCPAG